MIEYQIALHEVEKARLIVRLRKGRRKEEPPQIGGPPFSKSKCAR